MAEDRITRRDFLDGVAITAAGLAAAAAAPNLTGAEAALRSRSRTSSYPPTDTGIVGQRNAVIRDAVAIDGFPNPKDVHSTKGGPGIHPRHVRDVDDVYDLVVVGAGASGLASAKWYQDRFGANAKILLIDPLPDFGGHSHRNEFHIGDTTLLRNGGTVNLDSIGTWNRPAGSLLDIPGSYGQPALDMLAFCGVTPNSFPSSANQNTGLRQAFLFPRKDWGTDSVLPNTIGTVGLEEFLKTTPYSPAAQAGIVRAIEDEDTDWIALKHGPKTDQQKKAILAKITYKEYLKTYVGLNDEATGWFQRNSHGLFAAGIHVTQAGDMWALEEDGFAGLNLEPTIFPGIGRTAQQDMQENGGPTRAWPDGNTSLLRLLVSKLIPSAIGDVNGARPNQETILVAKADYSELDRRDHKVRIRLNNTVVDVKPAHGRNKLAEVTYVRTGGDCRTGERVLAKHVVMACWNRVTARLVDGLPHEQVKNLDYARKAPLIYCRVGLNNWQAFSDARVSSITPRGNSLFWDSTSLQVGQRFGTVYGPPAGSPVTPDKPALISLTCTPGSLRAKSQLESYEEGRRTLLEMRFRDFEHAIVDVLDRSLNKLGGDFDPERDIHSIMVNRWNYGYAYELTSTYDPSLFGPNDNQPHVKGRRPYKNVAIANSDSGAFAYTHSAINEAYRAVQDLP
ncbi:MAG TPA: NAD(P)-binding protein [Solirubrobacteraceae bacterium]|nr:NAD(P)-binding protein [Solirubrobacteraceae bacterium]